MGHIPAEFCCSTAKPKATQEGDEQVELDTICTYAYFIVKSAHYRSYTVPVVEMCIFCPILRAFKAMTRGILQESPSIVSSTMLYYSLSSVLLCPFTMD